MYRLETAVLKEEYKWVISEGICIGEYLELREKTKQGIEKITRSFTSIYSPDIIRR
jgi:hypothetical protein